MQIVLFTFIGFAHEESCRGFIWTTGRRYQRTRPDSAFSESITSRHLDGQLKRNEVSRFEWQILRECTLRFRVLSITEVSGGGEQSTSMR